MYGALRSALFAVDPERAHHLGLAALKAMQVLPGSAPRPEPRLQMDAFGLTAMPLGMAAGFDKGAEAFDAILRLGFGHIEVGTVTPRPQPGNDGLRMQRWPDHQAVVNRLGFPGPGVDVVARRLKAAGLGATAGGATTAPTLRAPSEARIVAANIGPNKDTPAEAVPDDIRATASALAPYAAFLTINVSSPNTPGLRALQTPEAVARLVRTALEAASDAGRGRPVLVKLHPDASDEDLVRAARAAVDAGASGIVATNTTRARPPGTEAAIEGGLSGAPLRERARAAVAALHKAVDVPIIGVGGVFTGADALAMVRAGATWVQAYTGFIYRGPRMAHHVHRELLAELDRAGLDRLAHAVGQPA